jgi:transposase
MPNDLPAWSAVSQQTQRWLAAGCFEALAHDLRAVLRMAAGRAPDPTAAVIDSRTIQSTPESGTRAGYDGAERKRCSKVHMAVDTLGHLLALHVTSADIGDREEVGRLTEAIQDAAGENVTLAYVDQGYTGETAAEAANKQGIALHVVKLPEAKRGFVLLPRRWVVERSACRGSKISPAGKRLRGLCFDSGRSAFRRPRLPHARPDCQLHAKCITPFRIRHVEFVPFNHDQSFLLPPDLTGC